MQILHPKESWSAYNKITGIHFKVKECPHNKPDNGFEKLFQRPGKILQLNITDFPDFDEIMQYLRASFYPTK